MIQKWEEWPTHQVVGQTFRGGSTSWRNLWSSTGGKCQVLYLERSKPEHQYSLEDDRLESSFVRKNLGMVMDSKLMASRQCTPVEKRPMVFWAVLGRALSTGWGKWSFCFTQHQWGCIWSIMSISGLSSTKRIRTYGNQSSSGSQRQLRHWRIFHERRGWESWNSSVWRTEGLEGSYQLM